VTFSPRIVSLVPSVTELLIDLGLGPFVVGRTGFCIHPASAVASIAKVGGTKDVHVSKLRALAPTHVVVNVDENRLDTVQAVREFVPHVIVTHPIRPEDNLALIDQLVSAFAPEFIALYSIDVRATKLKDQIRAGLQRLQTRPCRPQSVLYLIWREPWMTVARDTYISHMLSLIGWRTWPNQRGGDAGAGRYPVVDWVDPALQAVQRVLLSSEPFSFKPEHAHEVQHWLPQARVQVVDGEMLSWYGSRSVAGLAYLASLADSAELSSE
jgi:ABC-type Fe3+-hydroxamate transport system substrate-binding protein